METMIGTIMTVAFDYAPQGWALCNGQVLQIQSNQALYALLGTTYGGDGKTTFALPDLRGRTIVGSQAPPKPGITAVGRGKAVGVQSVTVTATGSTSIVVDIANLPKTVSGVAKINGVSATSTLYATTSGPGATIPPSSGAVLSGSGAGPTSAAIYYTNPTPAVALPAVPLSDDSVKTVIGGTASFGGAQIGSAAPAPLEVKSSTSTTMSVVQPSLGVTYIICTNGYYPPRD